MSQRFEISEKCGCNNTATKPISKTASTTKITKFQRPTPFNVRSKINLIAIVLIMTQLLLSIGQVDAMSMRPRQLRKRHSNMNANLDWENPCGGVHMGTHSGELKQRQASLELVKTLTTDIYNTIKANNKQLIQTDDIGQWSAYNKSYKFLPKLRRNSSVALKRWHRNMQTFVASFSYLHNKSRKFDEARRNNQESPFSKELKELLLDARHVLCEIESSINRTTPYNSGMNLTSHISPDAMNKRLKFRTKTLDSENRFQVDTIDLKFVKFYFTQFLKKMMYILNHNKNRLHNSSSSKSVSASEYGSVSGISSPENSNEINASISGRRQNRRGRKRNQPKKLRHALQKSNSTPSIALA
ncbi:uncharacterized protein LOC129946331 isoform X2 [Eupeodes corollae]|uniref:uncharacterized protein LOC129946331 isoform X2 n=1 Tax=Eupeodes corollae TaxID=290404 RepID=UPI0024918C46|nr:uncharacterized protein LOC129946331 isoform X2 [Eupeodes corollae]